MSAAAEATAAGKPGSGGKGTKKLILILAAALLLLLAGGAGVAYVLMSRAAAAAAADEDGDTAPKQAAAHDGARVAPTFVALDPFVVNLADKDAERYAQIGLTLEVDDPKFAEQMKVYMPAIRNAILMILAHKTSQELLERAGKEALANEIMREAVRPLGIEIADAEAPGADTGKAKGKRSRKRAAVHNPVQQVHFSSFIIQ